MNERQWTSDNTPTRVDATIANADLNVTIRRAIETLNRLVSQFNSLLQTLEQYVTWPELWEWPGSENLIRAGNLVANAIEVLVGDTVAHANVGDVVIESALAGANWIGASSAHGSQGTLFMGGTSVATATIEFPTTTSDPMVVGFANSVCFQTGGGIYVGPNDNAHVYMNNGDLAVQIENNGMLYPTYVRATGYFSSDGTEGESATIGTDLEADPPIAGATFKNGLYVGGEIAGSGGVGGVAPPEDGVLYGMVNTAETGVYFEAIPVLEAPYDGFTYGRWVGEVEGGTPGVLAGYWVLVPEEAPDDGYLWARYYDAFAEIMMWDMTPPEVISDIYVYGRGYDYELGDWVWVPVTEEAPGDIYVYGRGYDYDEEVWYWVPVTEECPDDGYVYARWYDATNEIWQWVVAVEEVPDADGLVYGRCSTAPTGGTWVLVVPELQTTNPVEVYGRAWFPEYPTPVYVVVVPEVFEPTAGVPYVRQDGDWVETYADAEGEGVYGRSGGLWEEVIPMADFDIRFATLAAQCELVIDVQDETGTTPYARIRNSWLPIIGFPGQIDVEIDEGVVFVGLPIVNGVPTISGGLNVASGNLTIGDSYNIVLTGLVNTGQLQVNGTSTLTNVTATTGVFASKLTANGAGEGLLVTNDARVSGIAYLKTLDVNGTGKVGSTFEVIGATTLRSTLAVSGKTTLTTCNCSTLNSSGAAKLESLETIHQVKVGTSLQVVGNTLFGGDVSAGNITCNYVDARTGTAIVRGTYLQATRFTAIFGSGNINLDGGDVHVNNGSVYATNYYGTWAGSKIPVAKIAPGASGYYLKTDGSSAFWALADSGGSGWPDNGTTKASARVTAMHVKTLIFDL